MPEGREKAERQPDKPERKPNPPGALPEMVIDQRRDGAGDQTQPEPEGMPLEEIIDIALAVLRESAGAEKNDDADRQQAEDSEKQDIGALPMHDSR